MKKMGDMLLRRDAFSEIVMGNTAIVRAMVEAGTRVVSSYPGSPTPEIAAAIASIPREQRPFYFEFSTNEKVATELAYGAAVNGHLSTVFFKSVGLNVAADTFVQLSLMNIIGGMVVYCSLDWVRQVRNVMRKPQVRRMETDEVIQHTVLAISFTVLVITGFALRFPEAWWVDARGVAARLPMIAEYGLAGAAVWRWTTRPADDAEPETPPLLRAIDGAGPLGVLGIGFVLAAQGRTLTPGERPKEALRICAAFGLGAVTVLGATLSFFALKGSLGELYETMLEAGMI